VWSLGLSSVIPPRYSKPFSIQFRYTDRKDTRTQRDG
jgi:hypothetical protein